LQKKTLTYQQPKKMDGVTHFLVTVVRHNAPVKKGIRFLTITALSQSYNTSSWQQRWDLCKLKTGFSACICPKEKQLKTDRPYLFLLLTL